MGWDACIDAVGRKSFRGECRGVVVWDDTATAHEFWTQVVERAREAAADIEECPHPIGKCEFHDDL
jgi:hypothetical protein